MQIFTPFGTIRYDKNLKYRDANQQFDKRKFAVGDDNTDELALMQQIQEDEMAAQEEQSQSYMNEDFGWGDEGESPEVSELDPEFNFGSMGDNDFDMGGMKDFLLDPNQTSFTPSWFTKQTEDEIAYQGYAQAAKRNANMPANGDQYDRAMAAMFGNEGGRTGVKTSLNSSARGRYQITDGTRGAIYNKYYKGAMSREDFEQRYNTDPDFEYDVARTYTKELVDKHGIENFGAVWYGGEGVMNQQSWDYVPGAGAGNKMTVRQYNERYKNKLGQYAEGGPVQGFAGVMNPLAGFSPEMIEALKQLAQQQPATQATPSQPPTTLPPQPEPQKSEQIVYNPMAQLIDMGLDITTGFVNKINNAKANRKEREQFLKALQPVNYENPYREGINNLPIYT